MKLTDKKGLALCLAIAIAAPGCLWAQEASAEPAPQASLEAPATPEAAAPEAVMPLEEGPFVIRRVDFEIAGHTMELVLREKVDIKIGRSFPTRAELEAYLADRRQLLLNERVLASVEARYEATSAPGGGYDVVFTFSTKDSWNIIALPSPPQYDSNSGLRLSVKGRDYNFLGSMQKLSLDLAYKMDETGRSGFGATTSFTLPFSALAHTWSFAIGEDFYYYPDGTPTTSVGSLSLGVTFRELGFPVTLTGSQGLSFNPDGDSDDPDAYYLTDSVSLGASIPTGIKIGSFDEISYGPSVGVSRNWSPAGPLKYDGREGTTYSFSQSLSFGRGDWEGNMRKGFAATLSNANSFNDYKDVFTSYIDGSVKVFANYRQRLGLAARAIGFYRCLGDQRTEQGGNLRGVLDDRIDCEDALFVNLDLPVKLFDFPAHVVIKKNWLDFELQASPFLDAAVAKREGAALGTEDLWYAGGLEFLVFPTAMRNFTIRASAGFDLQSVYENKSLTAPSPRDGASPYEIYFGMSLLY